MKIQIGPNDYVELIDNSDQPMGETFSSISSKTITAESSLSKVISFSRIALGELKKIGDPDELEISFGIEGGGEGGFFGISKVHAKSTINIKAKWQKN
jgi:hypothetical protein